jgi:hypothetical protein
MALSYFSTKSWVFINEKLVWLRTQVPTWDSQHFQLDKMETIDHIEFIKNGILGAKLYLLKEGTNAFSHARRHFKR